MSILKKVGNSLVWSAMIFSIVWTSYIVWGFSLVGCKAQYGDNGGDESRDLNADDGSVVNGQEIGVGGDLNASGDGGFATGGSVGVGAELEDGGINKGIVCTDFKFPDGPDGSVWKPESESDGNLAIVFDDELNPIDENGEIVPFESVVVYLAEDNSSEKLTFVGVEGESERQVWRAELPGDFYTGQIDIIVGNGKACTVQINGEPGDRVD